MTWIKCAAQYRAHSIAILDAYGVLRHYRQDRCRKAGMPLRRPAAHTGI